MSTTTLVDAARVRAALDEVRDPELDQPVTDLGFVSDVRVHDSGVEGCRVEVDLRLPTYFCAPNFAWVMVADADRVVRALDGVDDVRVVLHDHMVASEVTDAVAVGRSFDEAFPGLADGSDLDGLRTHFRRKAFVVRQETLARRLRADGRTPDDLARMCLSELPDVPEARRYRELRGELGLPTDPDAPLLLHDDGRPVPPAEADAVLARSRLTRVSVEGNADFCQGLLATRAEHDAVLGETDARPLPRAANPFNPVRPATADRAAPAPAMTDDHLLERTPA